MMGDDVDATPLPIIHGAGSLIGGIGVDTVDFSSRTLYGVKVDMTAAYTITSGVVSWGSSPPLSGTAQSAGSLTTVGSTITENVKVGNDIENVLGTDWADSITGNALDNKLTGYQGNDTLVGGLGDDTFDERISAAGLTALAVDSGADTITGGGGADTVDYSTRLAANGGVWAALDGVAHSGTFSVSNAALMVQVYGQVGDVDPNPPGLVVPYILAACVAPAGGADNEGDNIGKDVENLIGGLGDDCLFGQPKADAICTSAPGNCQNQLSGKAGSDMLFGNDEDDLLEGGGGTAQDALDCGGGQGNVGRQVGTGGAAASYQLTCQFAF